MNVIVLCESNHHHVCSQVYDVQNNLESTQSVQTTKPCTVLTTGKYDCDVILYFLNP